VLGDIRGCVDDLLDDGADPLLIVNLDRDGTFVDDGPDPLVVRRRAHEVRFLSDGPDGVVAAIRSVPVTANVLVSGLRGRDLRALAPPLATRLALLGYRREVGYWLLLGPSAGHVAAGLRSPRSTPLGMGRDTS
jgi:hypothetical protein